MSPTAGSPTVRRGVLVALDVGTSTVKAAALGLDDDGLIVETREQRATATADGRHEMDPESVLVAVRDALRACIDRLEGAEVVGLVVSAAMHGLVGVDGGGRPVTPILTWADSRAAGEAAALASTPDGRALHLATGTPVHPMAPLAKLRWWTTTEPGVAGSVRWWLGLKDWVLWWLTGEPVTEVSSASATGLLGLGTETWSPEALAVAGITADRLPPVRATTAALPLGRAAATDLGLPAGTPVVLGAGDGPAANLGCGAVGPGVAALSVGTSAAVRVVVPRPVLDPAGSLFCYALADGAWVVGGALSNGGSVVDWAHRALAPDLPRPRFLAEVEAVPAGADGLAVVPYLMGERAPLWDPALPGAVVGLAARHGRAHLARAAVEGVALQLRLLIDTVDRLDGVAPVAEVRATGGALREPPWRSVLAAASGRPLVVVDGVEGSVLGAAALGLVGFGLADDLLAAAEGLVARFATLEAVEVDPAAAVAHRELRRRLPGLVRALGPVADLVERTPPTGT